MRRSPETIRNAHVLDPARRSLFVEGKDDRIFFEWFTASSRTTGAMIVEIAHVEIAELSSNRERILAFAHEVSSCERIRGVIDRDLLDCSDLPANVWATDFRSLESYLLRLDLFKKVIKFSLQREDGNASQLLAAVVRVGRWLAAARAVSAEQDLKMKFQDWDFSRYLKSDGWCVEMNFDRALRTLMQNAKISLSRREEIAASIQRKMADLADEQDLLVVHAKDAIQVCAHAFAKNADVKSGDTIFLLRAAFDSRMWSDNRTLVEVGAFLTAA